MSMFNMGGMSTVTTINNNFLSAGIHHVTFKGLNKSDKFPALELNFEAVDGSGVHTERIFEPRSAERTQSQFGTNPSEVEQFMCKIKQIIAALDPDLSKRLETDGSKFAAPDFDSFIILLKKYLDKKEGTQTYIKLIPTSGNYVGFPGYIARISKDGNLYMSTTVIGEGLTLTSKEKTAIENATNAKPTDMSKISTNIPDELADLKSDFSQPDEDDDSGLPF